MMYLEGFLKIADVSYIEWVRQSVTLCAAGADPGSGVP
jgi:hypothetical protein